MRYIPLLSFMTHSDPSPFELFPLELASFWLYLSSFPDSDLSKLFSVMSSSGSSMNNYLL